MIIFYELYYVCYFRLPPIGMIGDPWRPTVDTAELGRGAALCQGFGQRSGRRRRKGGRNTKPPSLRQDVVCHLCVPFLVLIYYIYNRLYHITSIVHSSCWMLWCVMPFQLTKWIAMKRLRFWKSIFNKAAVNTGIAEPQFEADFEEITWLMVVSREACVGLWCIQI